MTRAAREIDVTAVDASRPAWATDFTERVPRELDLKRSFISYDEVYPDPVNESKLAEAMRNVKVVDVAGLPFPSGSALNGWEFVGLTSRKRSRWRWWLGRREWIVTFYFQASIETES